MNDEEEECPHEWVDDPDVHVAPLDYAEVKGQSCKLGCGYVRAVVIYTVEDEDE